MVHMLKKRIHHHLKNHSSPVWAWIKHHTQVLLWIGASLAVILIAAFIIWIATMRVPTITSFADRKVSSSTKIYDRTGTVVLYDVFENVKRTIISGDQITQKTKEAVIAIEDKDFYSHNGIKISSIIRAGLSQFIPFIKQSGGSTITQQLVKNTLLTQEKSITRKVKEWVLAIKLERIMTKDEILAMYFNEAPYGGTIYGIQEASRLFFGKNANEVTLAESAYLAAIPNAPSFYSPYGKNKDRLEARKNLVLSNMFNQGYITEAEYIAAKNEVVVFKPLIDASGKSLHFVEHIRQYLETKYGADVIRNQGLKVITTIDWDLQQVAEKTINENAFKNERDYGGTNSALVAIDPKTGQLLSMVGSRDYFDRTIDGAFNVATAGRQPGSSFKPIVYARAFEKGFLPETVLFDIPTQFGPCDAFDRSSTPPCYAPDNYDNKFVGPISLRNALGQSRNIPAVQLLSIVGLPDALETGKRLGLTTLDRNSDRYGLTLVLGGGEVSLLDMTSVYGVFANEGVRNPIVSILEVTDAEGNILEQYVPKPVSVMSANAARSVSSILSDNVARTPLFGANSFFYFGGRPVAGKTGTTNSNKDAWVFGYTPSIAVGVWSGNNDNTPMKKGSSISGPAWRTFMDYALTKLPYDRPNASESFNSPDTPPNYLELAPVLRGAWAGGESFFIDSVSGKLATELTPNETKVEKVIPNPHNILYWVDPSNPTGPKPANPSKISQFDRWEKSFQSWIANHPGIVPGMPVKPLEYDDIHTEANKPVVTLVDPVLGSTLGLENNITVQVTTQSNFPVKTFDWYLNEIFIGSTNSGQFSFIPTNESYQLGINELKIIATDIVYNKGELVTPIIFQ